MRITSWNINSIRRREALVADFLAREQPDVLLLQEIKCEEHQFPALAFSPLGYTAEIVGQKSYNGVAILSRIPVEVSHRTLPWPAGGAMAADPHSRYLQIRADKLTIGNLYLPNGNSGGEAGYAYKLEWLAALRAHAQNLLDADQDFVLAGDYNVCPTDADFAPGAMPRTDALVRPETRSAFRALLWTGLTDALRAVFPAETLYTFWDYQAGCWDRNLGLRIDHALLSPRIAERLKTVTIAKAERAQPTPSDHVPITVELVS